MKVLKGWMKPFETKETFGKLTKVGNVEFGLIETKTQHCYIHKTDFENEYHKSLSGKEFWKGCPHCRSEQEKLTLMQAAKKTHQERMAKLSQPEEIYQQPIKKAKGF